MSDTLNLARKLAPRILFDRREPFFPRWIGVSRIASPGPSPSFRRDISPPPGGSVLEYAIYWDWDIQHLYDLEHVWLYLDAPGDMVDAEASFHGRYLKSILPDRSNARDGRLTLYSQPGKHAFAPLPAVFRLLPECEAATSSAAGAAGAEVFWTFQDRITHDRAWDGPVRDYLRRRSFEPAWEFDPWPIPDGIFTTWEDLRARLPEMFMEGLKEAGAI